MEFPEDLKYTTEHEWVKDEVGQFKVGITDYAQDALGDVVYVSLPTADTRVEVGGTLGEVESTKSVSEIYAPFTGEVRSVNDQLNERPELMNEDPYGEGWYCIIEPDDIEGYTSLMSVEEYKEFLNSK